MVTNKGTPKTLKQALFNAFEAEGLHTSAKMIETLEAHVRDFAAQKFSVPGPIDDKVEAALQTVFKKIFTGGL
jgi:hypothetical protein